MHPKSLQWQKHLQRPEGCPRTLSYNARLLGIGQGFDILETSSTHSLLLGGPKCWAMPSAVSLCIATLNMRWEAEVRLCTFGVTNDLYMEGNYANVKAIRRALKLHPRFWYDIVRRSGMCSNVALWIAGITSFFQRKNLEKDQNPRKSY